MPLDPSIFSALGTRPKSAFDYLKDMAEADQTRQQTQLQNLQLLAQRGAYDDAQQARAQRNRSLSALQALGADASDEDVARAYRSTGDMKAASEYLESVEKRGKEKAAARKDDVAAGGDRLKQYRTALDFIDSPQGAARWLQAQFSDPLTAPVMAAHGTFEDAVKRIPVDAQSFSVWRKQAAMGMEKFMEQQRLADAATETVRHNKASEGLTARGQNMTDARAREATATAMSKPFEVTGSDGLPVLVQQDKQGNIKPVEGFGPKSGASKPLNDSQAKALLFGSRMQEANKVLGEMSARGTEMPSVIKRAAEAVPLIGGGLGTLANGIQSDDQQSVEQAQRDFVNAVLRRESGAAISPSEFESAKKQYFPEIGDSAQVRQQKAKARQLAIQGMLAEVPEGQRRSISKPASSAGKADQGGVVNWSDL